MPNKFDFSRDKLDIVKVLRIELRHELDKIAGRMANMSDEELTQLLTVAQFSFGQRGVAVDLDPTKPNVEYTITVAARIVAK